MHTVYAQYQCWRFNRALTQKFCFRSFMMFYVYYVYYFVKIYTKMQDSIQEVLKRDA